MTAEQLTERYELAQRALVDALNELGPDHALCGVLEKELNLEDHEDAHRLLGSLVQHGAVNGYQTVDEFVSLAFNMGRKFGLMEAADSFGSLNDDRPS
jgi:hypothetical protein